MTQLILIYHKHENHFEWFKALPRFLEDNGWDVRRTSSESDVKKWIRNAYHVFIWNGSCRFSRSVLNIAAENGVGYTIMEVGWFPQNKFWHLDSKGINAKSSLCEDDLSWVDHDKISRMHSFSREYIGDRFYSGADSYLFCPLQLASDTNIVEHSPFKDMQSFIDYVEETYPDPIVFKKHPRDKGGNYSTRRKRNRIVSEGDALDFAKDASGVVGINSTVLLETTMAGIPTVALGDGLLNSHCGREGKLLAALVDRQIPVKDRQDLTYWFHRIGCGWLIDGC